MLIVFSINNKNCFCKNVSYDLLAFTCKRSVLVHWTHIDCLHQPPNGLTDLVWCTLHFGLVRPFNDWQRYTIKKWSKMLRNPWLSLFSIWYPSFSDKTYPLLYCSVTIIGISVAVRLLQNVCCYGMSIHADLHLTLRARYLRWTFWAVSRIPSCKMSRGYPVMHYSWGKTAFVVVASHLQSSLTSTAQKCVR